MATRKHDADEASSQGDHISKSMQTRARILDSAAHVLSTKGFADTRLSDVAAHAQLQTPSIYYHFSSRDELIEEVMFAGIAEMRKSVQHRLEELGPATSPIERIMVAAEAHLRQELETSDYASASIRNSDQLPEPLRWRQRDEFRRYSEMWRGLFQAAAKAGQIRPDLDVQMALRLTLGALNWSAEWWDPRRESAEAVIENAILIIRRGIGRP